MIIVLVLNLSNRKGDLSEEMQHKKKSYNTLLVIVAVSGTLTTLPEFSTTIIGLGIVVTTLIIGGIYKKRTKTTIAQMATDADAVAHQAEKQESGPDFTELVDINLSDNYDSQQDYFG